MADAFLPALNSKESAAHSRRRFGTRLMRKLEDDYHVWINVPVGPKQFRPDFVILHPGRGILVLEVKDWKLPTIRQMDRFSAQLLTDRGLVTEANPIEQARRLRDSHHQPFGAGPSSGTTGAGTLQRPPAVALGLWCGTHQHHSQTV